MQLRLHPVTISSPIPLLLFIISILWIEQSTSCCCLAFVLGTTNRNIHSNRHLCYRDGFSCGIGKIGKDRRNRVPGFDIDRPAVFRLLPLLSLLNDDTMNTSDNIDKNLENALRSARTDPNAVVLSLWPSAVTIDSSSSCQIDVARSYLQRSHAQILHEASVEIPVEASTLLVMAAYWGEDWLRTNCWYGEQPLEELGMDNPSGSWPGAKWKKELCFRQEGGDGTTARMHVFVAIVDGAKRRRLWSDKYATRAGMARVTGHAGNSCMHLTDDQSQILRTGISAGGGGMDCNASYAFACARCLLNPLSIEFLRDCACRRFPNDDDLLSDEFMDMFGKFCEWLGDRSFEDFVEVEEGGGKNEIIKRWNRPPIL